MNSLFQKKRAGQITLLAILLGVLGLTVGLSVASRSLSDLKQASYVDFGTKALAAAESGAEWGLNQVSTGGSLCVASPAYDLISNNVLPGLKLAPLNIQTLNVTCQSGGNFLRKTVSSDDVAQANMASANGNSSYSVFWQNTAPAVEITVLYSDYTIKRYAYNSGAYSSPPSWVTSDNFLTQNGLSGAVVGNCPNTANFQYQSPAFSFVSPPWISQIRIRPLGGPSDIQICGNSSLESQSTVVTSTATTKNNVIKRIQVTKDNNGALPAIFDNVIFSGGDLTKN